MPTRDEIQNRLFDIITIRLDPEPKAVKLEAHLVDDLGADSLGLIELVLDVEENFEIDIPDEDTEKIHTVGDALDYLVTRLKA